MPLVLVFAMFTSAITSSLTVPIVPVEPTPQEVWIEALHQCENPDNVEKVWDTNNQWSYGYLQFQMSTWLKYKKLGATKNNIGDDELQKKIATYVLDNGGQSNWFTCSRVVKKSLGAYPAS